MRLLILIMLLQANGLRVPYLVYALCLVRIVLQGLQALAEYGEGKT